MTDEFVEPVVHQGCKVKEATPSSLSTSAPTGRGDHPLLCGPRFTDVERKRATSR